MEGLNYWAILVAAASAFLLGGVWYSPAVFGNIWNREEGVTDADFKGGHGAKVFGISFLMSLVAAFTFAFYLGPQPGILDAVTSGVVIGVCFIGTSYTINHLFGKRSMKLLMIDAGYHVVKFALYGVILGLWH